MPLQIEEQINFPRLDTGSKQLQSKLKSLTQSKELKMINRLAIVIVLATASGVAFAQTNPPIPAVSSTPPSSSPGASTVGAASSPGTSVGLRTADSAALAVRFVDVKTADILTTKLLGATVYNNQKEKLGEVEDLVIENGAKITGVVVSVGGFLGIGESYVVLDPNTIVVNQKDGNWQAFVDTSKDNLKTAPKFTYNKKKS